MTAATAWIGLGGNLGAVESAFAAAARALSALPGTRLLARSSLYRTRPQGAMPGQPEFRNAVLGLSTTLAPATLLAAMLEIEQRLGRVRDGGRDGPRTLDLDLLLYGQLELQQPGLLLPHPRLHQRAFVLVPLLEAGAQACVAGRSLAQWLEGLPEQGVLRLPPHPDWPLETVDVRP